jgi:Domain of unknown function (DUF4440)
MRDDRAAIQAVVRSINAAWVHGRPEEMRDLLDDEVVMVQPGFEMEIRGPDAAIASYGEFFTEASIHEFREGKGAAEAWGDTGVCWFSWTIRYAMGGEDYHETGHDLYVLARRDAGWRVVWRTLTSGPVED